MLMDRNRPLFAMLVASLLAACQPASKKQNEASTSPVAAPYADSSVSVDETDLDAYLGLTYRGHTIPEELRNEGALRSGRLWQYIYEKEEAALQAYYQENKIGFDAFNKNPVAYNGTPALIFRLLPVVMPELFSDQNFQKHTGYYKLKPEDQLPWGLAYTKPPVTPGSTPSPLLVNLTCGACHTGRVELENGQIKPLFGAPSTVADVNGFRSILLQAVNHPAYTYENFAAALRAKKDGELYGMDRLQDERIDRAIFFGTEQSPALGQALVQQFKDNLLKRSEYARNTVGTYSYKGDLRLLGHSPGHIDFPAAVALAVAPVAEVQADPMAALKKYFPAAPGIGDIMSVWRQATRVFAQWDGNLKNKLTRNLGAELGIAGDPRAVNFPNALLTTAFVDQLPAPTYPFKVDLVKAAAGKKIYEQACASCHEHEVFMPVAAIGTEPGRAVGLTQDSRQLLIGALKAACSDKTQADCQAPDEDIVVNRVENPGYISLPMDGIWARAPYLHNGSVPTLYHLLVPERRPTEFRLDNLRYDQRMLGFAWQLPGKSEKDNPTQNDPSQSQGKGHGTPVIYDTRIPGYGNGGHADIKVFNGGIDFGKNPAQLDALLEYLKTR